jgi:hypothetical protein
MKHIRNSAAFPAQDGNVKTLHLPSENVRLSAWFRPSVADANGKAYARRDREPALLGLVLERISTVRLVAFGVGCASSSNRLSVRRNLPWFWPS